MAPVSLSAIDHFTHPGHSLQPLDANQDYLCDGCKTLGSGKKYRCCQGCDFDLHDYCATCPQQLSSFLHPPHALTLVMRKPQGTRQVNRICDICADPVEGLFYRCKDCEFDVHPLCTQLPDRLQHALHTLHSLELRPPGTPGFCAVCRALCDGWTYGCGPCNFNIHLECVLEPVVPCQEPAETCQYRSGFPRFDQGIPFQPPPYNGFPYYGPGNPSAPGNFYPLYNPQAYNMNPGNFMPHNYYDQAGAPANHKKKKSMFSLVGQLAFGVMSNVMFGVDLYSAFAG